MNKTKTFIISLIVGIIIGSLGYMMINAVLHSGTTIHKGANGVDTFSNGTYGISFSFPDSYTITEKDTNSASGQYHTITLLSKADATPMNASSTEANLASAITLNIFKNPRKETLAEWVKNTPESNFKFSEGVATPASVAGVPAITYSWENEAHGNSIVFAHNGSIVLMNMTFLTYQDDIWKDFATLIQSLKLN